MPAETTQKKHILQLNYGKQSINTKQHRTFTRHSNHIPWIEQDATTLCPRLRNPSATHPTSTDTQRYPTIHRGETIVVLKIFEVYDVLTKIVYQRSNQQNIFKKLNVYKSSLGLHFRETDMPDVRYGLFRSKCLQSRFRITSRALTAKDKGLLYLRCTYMSF